MIVVRQMAERDDEAVCEISAECYRFAAGLDGFTEAQLNTALQEHCTRQHVSALRVDGAASVAESGGLVAGVIVRRGAGIQALFVNPAAHRKGIGRALFEHVERAIMKDGYSMLTVKTTASAVPFYSAMGMERKGTWHPKNGPFSGTELIVLEKQLKPQES